MDVTVAEAIRELRAQLEIAALEGKGKEIIALLECLDMLYRNAGCVATESRHAGQHKAK
jgi:hypothetical protein